VRLFDADPAFPRLHGRPPRGWLNDPNGCAYVDGRYHVFFQYNPDAPRHDAIKWGHVSSADLVDWRIEPVALVNRPGEPDAFGCWSGCLTMEDGVPTAAYSGVRSGDGPSEVLLARGERDLITWHQECKPVAGMPNRPGITHVRDPYLFEYGGRRYAIQGAGSHDGPPRILLYDATDLEQWVELGDLIDGDHPVAAEHERATIWECPCLFQLGGRWVLVVSLLRGAGNDQPGVRYLIGDMVAGPDGHPRYEPVAGGALDDGPCFYAAHVLVTQGRTLLWAWARERRGDDDVEAAGWAGSLTWCRELRLDGEALVSEPVPELGLLHRGTAVVEPGQPIHDLAFEVELPPSAGDCALWLVRATGPELVAEWTVPPRSVVAPRVLVDGSMVEIFPGGPRSLTTRAYPTGSSQWRVTTGSDSALRLWRLGLDSREITAVGAH
jgi:beta-fructofuranosidase